MSTVNRAASVGGHRVVTVGGTLRFVGQSVHLDDGGTLALYCALSLLFLIAPAILFVLAGAWESVRSDLTGRGMALTALWIAPAVSAVAAFGLGILHGLASQGQTAGTATIASSGSHPFLASVLGVAAFSALGLVFASAIAIAVVVARITLAVDTVQFGLKVGRRLSVLTVLAALAVIGWAAGLGLQAPPDTHLSYDVTYAALAPWSVVLAAGMAVVAALAVVSSLHARRYWRTAARLAQSEH